MSLCLGCPGHTQAVTLYYCCQCILLSYYQSQSVTHNTNSCHFKIAVIVFCSCQNLLLLSVFRCHSPALAYNAIVNGLYHWHTLSPYYPTVWHSIEIFPQINLSRHFLEPQISLSANCCQSHLNHQWFSLAVNSGADQWFKVKVLICSNWLTRKGSFTGFFKTSQFSLIS